MTQPSSKLLLVVLSVFSSLHAATVVTKVTVSPATVTLRAGAQRQFNASVQGNTNTAVTWKATAGTVDDKGLFTAPAVLPNPATATVTATSVADKTVSASATITLQNPLPKVDTVAPGAVNTALPFTLTLSGSGFLATSKVSLGGVALQATITATKITATGTSTAAAGTTLELIVSNPDPGAATSAVRHITVMAPVSVDAPRPSNSSVRAGNTLQYSAAVHNNSNTTVTWAVNGVAGGNAGLGTIDAKGLYTAPAVLPAAMASATAPSLSVTATSVADPKVSASTNLSLLNAIPAVQSVAPNTVAPGPVTLTINGTGFAPKAQVYFENKPLATTFISPTKLTAAGTAGPTPGGVAAVAVVNPDPGGASSNGVQVAVKVANPKMTYAAAYRFLEQASFGADPGSIAHLQQVGYDRWFQEQLAAPASGYDPPETSGTGLSLVRRQFFVNAITGPDQLRQKMMWALSQIWVTSGVKTGAAVQMIPYLTLLSQDAFATYPKLMKDVTLSPTMGRFLDMVNNDKPDPSKGIEANENYAREVLQLFTLGTVMLNDDGTQINDSQGNPLPVYDQAQVAQLALVFTGWTYPLQPGATPRTHNPAFWDGPMVAVETNHDKSQKSVFGTLIPPGQTAEMDLDLALQAIYKHKNLAPFVTRRLIQHFTTSNPSKQYVTDMVNLFRSSGGDLGALIKGILMHSEARAADSAPAAANFGHLREPVLLLTNFLKAVDASVTFTDNPLPTQSANMAQTVFNAPSVFNYFSPNYRTAGGTLYGPEFQILNPTTSLLRVNFFNTATLNRLGLAVEIDMTPWTQLASDPAGLVEALNQALLHGTMSDPMRASIVKALGTTTDAATRARNAMYLVASSSQYQVER